MIVQAVPYVSRFTFTTDDFDRMIRAGLFAAGESVALVDGQVVVETAANGAPGRAGQTPYRFSVGQYHRMIEVAILDENDRVELIHGEVVSKMPIGDPHIGCVRQLNELFILRCAGRVSVGVQDPVRLADSEPEPDISVCKRRKDHYRSGKPRPADVFLLIEVADTSVGYDRDVKGHLYADNGIVEFWLADVNDRTVTVYRGPRPDGTWETAETRSGADELTVAALPDIRLTIVDVFGPE